MISERFRFVEGKSRPHPFFKRAPLEALRAWFSSPQVGFEPTFCPCGSREGDSKIAEIDRYGLPLTSVMCVACGTVRFAPYLDEATLVDFYSNLYQRLYQRADDIPAYWEKQGSYGRRLLEATRKQLAKGDLVIEAGCGAGGALAVFQEAGFEVAGCDYDQRLLEAGRQRGITTLVIGSLDDLSRVLDGKRAALIYLHHVLEHVTDPLAYLRRCASLLRSNGRLLLAVPDMARADESEWAPGDLLVFLHIAHKWNFTAEGIERMAGRAGWRAARIDPAPHVKTPWSAAPELWMDLGLELSPRPASSQPSSIASDLLQLFSRVEAGWQKQQDQKKRESHPARPEAAPASSKGRSRSKKRSLWRKIADWSQS